MKILKSITFVIILAVVAVGIVAKNIILPLFQSGRLPSQIESNGVIKQQPGGIFQQIKSRERKSAQVADLNNLDWAQNYLRNPFMALTMVEAETVTDASVDFVEAKLPEQDFLVAIVHESGKALAVINDVVVGEGDNYDNYKVIKIGLNSVELEGPDGNKMLEF